MIRLIRKQVFAAGIILMLSNSGFSIQLITDGHFQTGANVLNPTNGVVQGPMQYTTANGSPIWNLAQWGSHSSIYGSTPTIFESGAYKWANLYKVVIMGPTNTADSDLKLTVNSISEYSGIYRQAGGSWPALLISQRISEPNGNIGTAAPWIDELTSLNFDIGAKLVYANNVYTNGYNPALHCAHFLIYFTVQNLNKDSSGYGDYMWFGLALYDDRTPLPGLSVMQDNGTGKLMYNIGIEPFCTNGLVLGQWKEISGDILSYVKDGLDAAWELGFLTNSTNYADYKIGGMNMGWEVPGLSCVTMQVNNFGLEAYGLYWPQSYEFNVNGDMNGWSFTNLTDYGTPGPTNGTWIFTASLDDPQLIGPAIRIDADTFTAVKVKVANAGNPAAASVAQLYWKCNGASSFTETCSQKVNIGNGGGWVEYTFDMTSNTNWCGEITQLRLDPVYYGDGHGIGIDYIRFSE